MHLHLEGSNTIASPREKVYSLLTDPNFIAGTLPDAEDIKVIDGSTLEARIKLRVAVVSAALRTTMSVAKTSPPSRATLTVEGSGSGSSIKIHSLFDLTGESPTTMSWSADADIEGVMAGIGSTLLRGFATKKVQEIFSGITSAIEGAK